VASEMPRIWAVLPTKVASRVDDGKLYFIRAGGILKGPGMFGHMGVSHYQIEIDGLIEIKSVEKENCTRDISGGAS
jgi:hypothetical protein